MKGWNLIMFHLYLLGAGYINGYYVFGELFAVAGRL